MIEFRPMIVRLRDRNDMLRRMIELFVRHSNQDRVGLEPKGGNNLKRSTSLMLFSAKERDRRQCDLTPGRSPTWSWSWSWSWVPVRNRLKLYRPQRNQNTDRIPLDRVINHTGRRRGRGRNCFTKKLPLRSRHRSTCCQLLQPLSACRPTCSQGKASVVWRVFFLFLLS